MQLNSAGLYQTTEKETSAVAYILNKHYTGLFIPVAKTPAIYKEPKGI